MKNNRNMKRFILIEFSLFIFIVLVSIIGSVMIFNIYEEKLEENNAYILTNLVKDNKELEEKVVKFILENEYGNEEIDTTLLEKYGITKEDLKFSSSTNELKNKIIKYDIVFIVTSFLILTLTFIIYTVNENKKIKSISNYLNEILNGNYHMDVRDYDEGVISHLKNDIYKVTIKLKEQHDLSIKDKKNLEETLSDISHQLKTPLTSMYVINDLLETDIDKDVKKELLLKNYSQLERIEWLVTSLLKISRLDSKTVVLKEKKEKLSK